MTPQRQVGTLAAHGAMASLFFGSCVSGQHAGKQVREREHARTRARARERGREGVGMSRDVGVHTRYAYVR